MKITINWKDAIILVFPWISLIFGLLSLIILSSIILSIYFIISLVRLYEKNNGLSLTVVFMFFFMLYSLSAPLSYFIFGEINLSFKKPFNFDIFLSIVSIINILIGVIIVTMRNRKIKQYHFSKTGSLIWGIILLLSFAFEMINIIRIGGVSVLLSGKAIYQEKISDLTLTLPAFELFLAASIFAIKDIFIRIKYNEKVTKLIIIYTSLSFPIIFIDVFLGTRGGIIRLFIIVMALFSFIRPFKLKIRYFYIMTTVAIIFILFFSYDARSVLGKTIVNGTYDEYLKIVFSSENIENSFNLGKNEFGVAFGNFNTYYNKYGNDPNTRFTIFEGIYVAIPRWLLPFEKPEQIVYVFRDEFFPERASISSISSTGFSFILEGYINLGFFGAVIIYLMMISIVLSVEKLFINKHNHVILLLYFMHFPIVTKIHRMSFGDYLGDLTTMIVVIIFVFFICELLTKKGAKINEYNGDSIKI